jgi:hypothetical protein
MNDIEKKLSFHRGGSVAGGEDEEASGSAVLETLFALDSARVNPSSIIAELRSRRSNDMLTEGGRSIEKSPSRYAADPRGHGDRAICEDLTPNFVSDMCQGGLSRAAARAAGRRCDGA